MALLPLRQKAMSHLPPQQWKLGDVVISLTAQRKTEARNLVEP